MSLTKLFNKNYLSENIKKSKGPLILFLCLVPILSCIMLIAINGSETISILDYGLVSIINILGMYVIPVIVSIILFGYVYRKTSVDFINSMPINRKSIFITNTIGGIVLILIMQIIVLIELLICSVVLKNIVIFPQMIINSFALLTLSYIFVFTATNIAMSISGNALTQIVVTALILFLIPFCDTVYNGAFFQGLRGYEINENINAGEIRVDVVKDIDYTTPYRMFSGIFYMTGSSFYNVNSMIRMAVLSIIYIAVGNYLFKKRKMENAEESFASTHMHLIIKGLTLVPMIVFLNLLRDSMLAIIFPAALVIIYYFVYDLITRKKVKFLHSIIGLILIVSVLQLAYMGVEKINKTRKVNYVLKTEISQVSIDVKSYDYYYSRYLRGGDATPILDYYMNDKELLELILEKGYELNPVGYNHDVKVYDNQITVEPSRSFPVNFKMNNGRIVKTSVTISNSNQKQLLEILSKDSNYTNILKNANFENGVIKLSNIIIDEDIATEIKREIKNEIDQMSLIDYEKRMLNTRSENITMYSFQNNELVTTEIPVDLNEKIFNIITSMSNKIVIENLENNQKPYRPYNIYLTYNTKMEEYLGTEKMYEYMDKMYYIQNELIEFIRENTNEKCDINEKFVAINIYPGEMRFFTNKIDELIKLLDKVNMDNLRYPEPVYKHIDDVIEANNIVE